MACVQNALAVSEKSGFAPNFLLKKGLPGAALCMLQRCSEAHDRLLPFNASTSSSSSPPVVDHHLRSSCICTADALGTFQRPNHHRNAVVTLLAGMHNDLCLRFTLSDSLTLAVINHNVSFELSSPSPVSSSSASLPTSSSAPLGLLPSLVQHLMTKRPRTRTHVALACALCVLPLSSLPHPPTAAALEAACASHVASAAAALVSGFTRAEESASAALSSLSLGSTLGNRDVMRAQAAAAAGMRMKCRLLRGDMEGVVVAVANASPSNSQHVTTCEELASAAAVTAAAAVGGAAVRLDCMMAPLLLYSPHRLLPSLPSLLLGSLHPCSMN